MIEVFDSQIKKMKERIEKNVHNNKNDDLKDLKIITCRNDWIVNYELYQQTENK